MVHHQLTTPNGTSLMGAATYPQLEQTSMKEWMEIMPPEYIKHHNKSKNYIDLINGHRILFRSLDDEGKARSLNLTAFHIEEASEVKFEYYVQLTTRLRNRATKNHKAILSSNPDLGWIKNEILLRANNIYNSDVEYDREKDNIDKNISVHIAPTKLNIYLPPNFYEDTARGREKWWIDRYLNGSFVNKTGLVYPQALDHIVEPFKIPDSWERLQGSDFGLVDPTVAIWGAIDPKDGVVYIYREHYESGKSVAYHAEKMLEHNKTIPYGLLRQPLGDPKGKARSEKDMMSTFDHYAEYGVYFRPGINKIEDGIYKVFTYFELGKLKVFSNLKHTIDEFQKYKYPPRKMGEDEKASEKPLDKDNHACFIAGTLIETNKGLVPIEKLKVGDYVKTRKGYNRIIDWSLTERNASVKKVSFSNGTYVIATGNHPIFVENKGFLAIDSLRYFDTIKVSSNWEELICQKLILWNGTENYGDDIQIQNTKVTEDITNVKENGFIEKSGRAITEKYLKGITFIIKTMTQRITKYQILKLLKKLNILDITQKRMVQILSMLLNLKNTLIKQEKKLQTGINQRKDENGIANMQEVLLKTWLRENTCVKDAVKDLVENHLERTDFVQTNADQSFVDHQELIMSKGNALSVGNTSQLINTLKHKHVLKHAKGNYDQKTINRKEHVNNVERSLLGKKDKNSVQTFVEVETTEKQNGIMRKEHALYADVYMKQDQIANQKHAQEVVVTNIEALKDKLDVYNITIEGEHEYFANGVLSHNCDSLKYLVCDLPDNPFDLINSSYSHTHKAESTQQYLPFALQDEDEHGQTEDWQYY